MKTYFQERNQFGGLIPPSKTMIALIEVYINSTFCRLHRATKFWKFRFSQFYN